MDYTKHIMVAFLIFLLSYTCVFRVRKWHQQTFPVTQTSVNRDVFFMHIHKTGGTTVDNLLESMAVSRNLSLALFQGNAWPDTRILPYVLNFSANHTSFQVLHNHVTYNPSELERCMSHSRLHVTLLRHPLAQFKSLFNFLQLQTFYNISAPDPVEVFLRSPAKFEKLRHTHNRPVSLTRNMAASFFIPQYLRTCLNRGDAFLLEGPTHNTGHSEQTDHALTNCHNVCQRYQDCGLLLKDLQFKTGIENDQNNQKNISFVQFIEQEFHVVMIHEYFDESLVLLKRLANWELKDILYLQARKKIYPFKYSRYTEAQYSRHQQWSPLDYEIYQYFKSKLEHALSEGGQDLKTAVELFRTTRRRFKSFCHGVVQDLQLYRKFQLNDSDIISVINSRFPVEMVSGQRHTVSGEDCILLALDPVILKNCLTCQFLDGRRVAGLCEGLAELCVQNHGYRIKGVLPLVLFQPITRLHWTGWPLLWGA